MNEKVRAFLAKKGYEDRLTQHKESIDTVEHAAQQIGCSEAEIAKTLSFIVDGKAVLIVMAGDGKVNGGKFKAAFHTKPSMIQRDMVEELTGFRPGGVCPFGAKEGTEIWLDVSMKRFEKVYPAAGSEYSSAVFTLDELEKVTEAAGWVDVCKGWQEEEE
ncbi:MAG: YbaK/EbsC family protein [Firmicutes bacterium]|nr:YbaK/EbsC family protein [Bacillota bacterium]